jgi:hypothetical protein
LFAGELPALGRTELLAAFDAETGKARAAFVLWQSGNETYLDCLLRGVMRAMRAAKARLIWPTGGH